MATTGMPNEAIAGYVRGLRELKAAFQALPQIVRDRMLAATETTVREIARGAQARLLSSPSVQTRNLYNHVAWSVTKTNGRGRVGISIGSTTVSRMAAAASGHGRLIRRAQGKVGKNVKVRGVVQITSTGARIDYPSRRAHFIEFGTKHMKAEPFMMPAAEAEKPHALGRAMAAWKAIETDVVAIGGGAGAARVV